MSGSATKAERGKTQIEVTTDTRRNLRLLAALTDAGMAEAAADAISRRLAEVRQESAGALAATDPRRGPQCGCGLYGDHDETHEGDVP